jgi:hypothetical protein
MAFMSVSVWLSKHPQPHQTTRVGLQRGSHPSSFAGLGLLVDLFVLCSVRGDCHAPARILDLNQNPCAWLAPWM